MSDSRFESGMLNFYRDGEVLRAVNNYGRDLLVQGLMCEGVPVRVVTDVSIASIVFQERKVGTRGEYRLDPYLRVPSKSSLVVGFRGEVPLTASVFGLLDAKKVEE